MLHVFNPPLTLYVLAPQAVLILLTLETPQMSVSAHKFVIGFTYLLSKKVLGAREQIYCQTISRPIRIYAYAWKQFFKKWMFYSYSALKVLFKVGVNASLIVYEYTRLFLSEGSQLNIYTTDTFSKSHLLKFIVQYCSDQSFLVNYCTIVIK